MERTAGKPIAEMFSSDGEAAFRDLEERVIDGLCGAGQSVIALGGGAVLREATRERIRTAGSVVWLTASVDTIARRLEGDAATAGQRPSLTGQGTLAEVEQVLSEREPIYRGCATLTVAAEGRSPEEVAAEIVSKLQE